MLNDQAHGVISIEDNLKCRLKNYKDLETVMHKEIGRVFI